MRNVDRVEAEPLCPDNQGHRRKRGATVEARFVISSSASRTIVKVQARICRIDDGRKWRLEEVRMVGLAGEGMRVGVISVL